MYKGSISNKGDILGVWVCMDFGDSTEPRTARDLDPTEGAEWCRCLTTHLPTRSLADHVVRAQCCPASSPLPEQALPMHSETTGMKGKEGPAGPSPAPAPPACSRMREPRPELAS